MRKITCKICKSKLKIWYRNLYDDRHGYRGKFNILRCINCGFSQTSPQISKAAIKNLYENYYPRRNINLTNIKIEDYKKPTFQYLWRKGLLAECHFQVKTGSEVLDIGSGIGYSLLYLKNMKCKPFGIDPDKNGKKVSGKFKIPFHYGFIDDKPFRGKLFDFITASQVIEHTNDPIKFLELCKKRLKPNGKIILSFPNTDCLTRKIFKKNWLHWHVPYHLNHFNRKSIKLLSDKVGLKIVKIKTVTPNLWTNLQIKSLLKKTKEGVRDTFWDGGKGINHSVKFSFLSKIFNLLEEYNYINRFIDLMGFGESIIVTLSIS